MRGIVSGIALDNKQTPAEEDSTHFTLESTSDYTENTKAYNEEILKFMTAIINIKNKQAHSLLLTCYLLKILAL